nr:MAG TPA: hypothetical protein [Caudoviricetes sp.]
MALVMNVVSPTSGGNMIIYRNRYSGTTGRDSQCRCN